MSIIIILVLPIAILAFANLFRVIFNNNKQVNQDLSIISLILLYVFSLVPMGVFVGYFISNRKIKAGNVKGNKFSKLVQTNGDLILIISIASTIFSLINIAK